MPYFIRFFRDPFWTSRGPSGGPWGLPGGPKDLPRPKTSQGISRAGLESFQNFIWYKVINGTLPITGTNLF